MNKETYYLLEAKWILCQELTDEELGEVFAHTREMREGLNKILDGKCADDSWEGTARNIRDLARELLEVRE